jgi:hypothetical protein
MYQSLEDKMSRMYRGQNFEILRFLDEIALPLYASRSVGSQTRQLNPYLGKTWSDTIFLSKFD